MTFQTIETWLIKHEIRINNGWPLNNVTLIGMLAKGESIEFL